MIKDKQDGFGHMYLDYMKGIPFPYTIERDDGNVYVDMPDGYFKEYDAWIEIERRAMKEVSGRVLDIGCGAGRHCLYLQEQGNEVTGTDNSPLALEVARQRGVLDARLCDLLEISPDLGQFDTIVMLGNNLSLLGTPAKAKRILRTLYRISSAKGCILGEVRDPYKTNDPDHIAYYKANRKKGKWGGQARIRIKYKEFVTPWTDFLMLSKSELEELTEGTGWRVQSYIDDEKPDSGIYIAVMKKKRD
ncbi:MAG: class I SAM-dependent methyltransferase [Dehalococcoidales bacterium]|nr:MAG: class I SAM-dependent methyltransferase [Dehalococcoidales bacterium]